VSSSSAIDQRSSKPRKRRFWRKPWPLRTALGLFALTLVLPVVLFFVVQYRAALVEKQSQVEREGLGMAREVGVDIDQELKLMRVRLATLAASPSLRTGGVWAFLAQAKASLQDSRGWIVLIHRDGTPLDSTGRCPIRRARWTCCRGSCATKRWRNPTC
jgi:hypothetical protein